MNRRRMIALSCLLALAAGACSAPATDPAAETYLVYYSALEDPRAEMAVDCESRDLSGGEEVVPALMGALLSGPETPGLTTPFPSGVRLLDWDLEGGVLHLDLSEPYGGLTGVNLTVADTCLTLTFCQLEGVESVYVTVEGEELAYRPIQQLTQENILLSSGADEPVTVEVCFWYPLKEQDALGVEYRAVVTSGTNSLPQDVLAAWAEGPTQKELTAALPDGTEVRSVAVVDGVCTVDLSQAFQQELSGDPARARLSIYALVNTLGELEGVDSVQIQIEGENAVGPVAPDLSLAGTSY